MLSALRDFWVPRLLFVASFLVAALLFTLVFGLPYAIEQLPIAHPVLDLFASDTTVRRTAIVSAVGLIVTACVFFRPGSAVLSRRPSKPTQDTMAGA